MTDTYYGDNEIRKDPDEVLDYSWDWNDADDPWLASGETISSYTVTVPSGITKDSDGEASGKVTAWLSGGAVGNTYAVACKIVTSDGRTAERTINVKVVQR